MTKLSAGIRLLSEDKQTIEDERVIVAFGDDYDTAKHSLEGQMPPGWIMIHLNTEEA